MEFTELKRMLNHLEIQEDVLTDRSIQTLHELKLIFKQRDKMLEMLNKLVYIMDHLEIEDYEFEVLNEAKQLIEQTTKID